MGGKTSDSSSSVGIPKEVMARYNAVNARAESVANQPFQRYSEDPNAFVAPLTETQAAGINNINANVGSTQPYFQGATQALTGAAESAMPYYSAADENISGARSGAQPLQGMAEQNIYGAQAGAQPLQRMAEQNIYGAQAGAQPLQGMAAQNIYGARSGAQPLQGMAAQNISGAQAGAQPYQDLATGYGVAGARGVGPGNLDIQRYQNPYIENVVGATLANQRQQQQQEQSAMTGDAISAGAFGGDRAGIAKANLARQQGMASAQTEAGLRSQAYSEGLGAAQQQQGIGLSAEQANRAAQAQAAGQMAAIGQQGFGQGITAAQAQQGLAQQGFGQDMSVAQAQQGLAQQGFGQGITAAQAQQGLAQQGFGQGITAAQAQQGLAQQGFGQDMSVAQAQQALGQGIYGIGAGVSQGLAGLGAGQQDAALTAAQAQLAAGAIEQQTQQAGLSAMYNQFLQQQGHPFQTTQFLSNIAQGTGALSGSTTQQQQPSSWFSDERLKEDIEPIGETYDGQKIFKYRFKGQQGKQIGLIAQDVERDHPEAVGSSQGYKTVDYDAATKDSASMGGSVTQDRAGQAYAKGGKTADDTMAMIMSILEQHRQAYPYGNSGLYGISDLEKYGPFKTTLDTNRRSPPESSRVEIHPLDYVVNKPSIEDSDQYASGGRVSNDAVDDYFARILDAREAMYVGAPWNLKGGVGGLNIPQGAPQVRQLMRPERISDIDGGMQQSMKEFNSAAEAGESIAKMYGTGKKAYEWFNPPAAAEAYAYGGVTGLPYSSASSQYVPEDETVPFKPRELEKPTSGTTKGSSGAQTLGDMATMAKLAMMFMSNGGVAGRAGYANGGNPGIGTKELDDLTDEERANYNTAFARRNAEEVARTNPDTAGVNNAPLSLGLAATDPGDAGREARALSPAELAATANVTYTTPTGMYGATSAGETALRAAAEERRRLQEELLRSDSLARTRAEGAADLGGAGREARALSPAELAATANVTYTTAPKSGVTGVAPYTPLTPDQEIMQFMTGDPNAGTKNPAPKSYLADLGVARAAATPAPTPGVAPVPAETTTPTDRSGLGLERESVLARIQADQNADRGGAGPEYRLPNGPAPAPTTPLAGFAPPPPTPGLAGAVVPPPKTRNVESWLVPLLSGLGAMASSPSRYLGSAILQGAAGAAAGYEKVQGNIVEREKIRAEADALKANTESINAGIATGAFGTTAGTSIPYARIRLSNGQYQIIKMPPSSEWHLYNFAPATNPSEKQAMVAEAERLFGSGSGYGSAPAPAAAGAQASSFLTPEVRTILARTTKQLGDGGMPEKNLETSPFENVGAEAVAAQDTKPLLARLGTALSYSPEGPVQEAIAGATAILNSITRPFNIPPITPDLIANREEIEKLRATLTAGAPRGSQTALELQSVMLSIPGNLNSLEGRAKIMAGLLTVNQKAIDRANYFIEIKNALTDGDGPYRLSALQVDRAGQGLNAEFSRSQNQRYAEEMQAFEMLFKTPSGLKKDNRNLSVLEVIAQDRDGFDERSGKYDEQAKKKLEELFKQSGFSDPNMVNRILRYY